MKKTLQWCKWIGIATGALALAAAAESASDGTAVDKVGVYDSRAVAYAHFWSPAAQRERNEAVAAARAAKASGDATAAEVKSRALFTRQKRLHEQVFSTAPAGEAMTALADRLPSLQRELGVSRLVSMWDNRALKNIPEGKRVDVTDRLVHEFISPTEKQQKVLDSMKTRKPLSLWRIKVLNVFGGA